MTQHTPGPWEITTRDTGVSRVYAKSGNPFYETGVDICANVANIANARLIAAAPEMLNALELLLAEFADPAGHYTKYNTPGTQIARALLARIEGGNNA